jgi:hypothetical protein
MGGMEKETRRSRHWWQLTLRRAAAGIMACGVGLALANDGDGEWGSGRGGGFFAWGRSAGSASHSSEPRAFRAELRAPFSLFSQHQAEPGLGSFFTSLTELSHEPARIDSTPSPQLRNHVSPRAAGGGELVFSYVFYPSSSVSATWM